MPWSDGSIVSGQKKKRIFFSYLIWSHDTGQGLSIGGFIVKYQDQQQIHHHHVICYIAAIILRLRNNLFVRKMAN